MGFVAMSDWRAFPIAAVLLAAGCGGKGQEPAGDDRAERPVKADKTAPGDAAAAVEAQLAEAEQEARAAMAERDWPLARKLLQDGMDLAKRSGHEFELERARLLLLLGDVERDGGKELDARRYYADAMAVYRVQGSNKGRFTVHLSQGDLEAARGDYVAASREYASAEALLGDVDDRQLEGDFLFRKGKLASRQMRNEDAIKAYTDAAKLFEIDRNQRARAEALLALALEQDAVENERQCRLALDKALALFRDIGDKDGEVRALHKAAAMAERARQFRKARGLLKKVHELYLALDRQADATKVMQHLSALPE